VTDDCSERDHQFTGRISEVTMEVQQRDRLRVGSFIRFQDGDGSTMVWLYRESAGPGGAKFTGAVPSS